MRRARAMSDEKRVTLLAWLLQRLASSSKLTTADSQASCRASRAEDWNRCTTFPVVLSERMKDLRMERTESYKMYLCAGRGLVESACQCFSGNA